MKAAAKDTSTRWAVEWSWGVTEFFDTDVQALSALQIADDVDALLYKSTELREFFNWNVGRSVG